MSRIELGGYIFWTSVADHSPRHVHVYGKGKLLVKWDLEHDRPMRGRMTRQILGLIEKLREEGRL